MGRSGSSEDFLCLDWIECADGRQKVDMLDRFPIAEPAVIEAEPGDAVFFNCLALHGSLPSRSRQARRTELRQMHAGSDRVVDGNRHPDERVVPRGWSHCISRTAAGLAS
ncbi:MAG: phytanoyl-CoA dioxygenase family protein [Boseongicola sp.]|nr:phytanoyl-CoA dioxygenase family protein [Boseongicola sp.]